MNLINFFLVSVGIIFRDGYLLKGEEEELGVDMGVDLGSQCSSGSLIWMGIVVFFFNILCLRVWYFLCMGQFYLVLWVNFWYDCVVYCWLLQ